MSLDLKNPQPGVYPGVDERVYHSLDCCSAHRLMDMAQSPMHCKWNIDHPMNQTPAMLMGSAIHCKVLTPELFAGQYKTTLRCAGITGKKVQCSCNGSILIGRQWFCRAHADGSPDPMDFEILTPDQYNDASEAAKALTANPIVSDMLAITPRERRELTLIWQDSETGLMCKSRLDCSPERAGAIFDLKGTVSASESDFVRQARSLGYHQQAAFHLEGARESGIPADTFYAVPFEKVAPFGVAIAQFGQDIIDLGDALNRQLIHRYAHCKETGVWPGYPENPMLITKARWMEQQLEQLEAAHDADN